MYSLRRELGRFRCVLVVALLVVFGVWVAPARGQILGDGWTMRRPLTCKLQASDAPGENVAWAEFYANGAQKPDGSDLRVTDKDRVLMPMRVLRISPDDDFIRIAFAATRGDGTYYVWWGNPKPAKAGPGPLEIKRGVLAEVYRFPGGVMDSEERMARAFERAGAPEGALFVPDIMLGFNPMGDDWTALIRYRGQFRLDKAGAYELALAVNNSGSVAIDGKALLFQHGAVFDARNHKTVDLTAGWHTIEAVQVNDGGGGTQISVAWRKAGTGRFGSIPANLFAPVAQAEEGQLETIGQAYTADFSVDPAAEVFVPPERFAPRYVFETRVPENLKQLSVQWDFGDNQTSSLARAHHYYLTPGKYTVTLTLKRPAGAGVYVARRRITVRDRLYERFPAPPEDGAKTALAILDNYNVARLTAGQLLNGMRLLKRHNLNDELLRWGQAWLENKEYQNERDVWQETFGLARLMESRELFGEASEAYRLAAQKNIAWDMKSKLLLWHCVTRCDYLDDAAQAYKLAEQARNDPAAKGLAVQRALGVAMVYAAVGRGDGKTAARLAKEIGPSEAKFERQQIDQGVMARNVESAIGTKDYETAAQLLQTWETDYPQAIVDGFTRLLKVKLLVAEDRPAVAARVAAAHARGVPESFYAAELLYRGAEAAKAAGKPADAKALLDLLQSKYPESPYAQHEPVMQK
jgi:PKD repeat protein